MSTTLAPFGLRVCNKPGGNVASLPKQSTIASGYNTAIYVGSPVTIAADGTLTATAVAGTCVGVFLGCEYVPTGQRPSGGYWPASQAATQIVAYYTDDPYTVYEMQANGTIAQADVGSQINTIALAGSTTTGQSLLALDTATLTNSANGTFRITGLTPGPDNAFGDAFTVVQIEISQHQFVATRVAF